MNSDVCDVIKDEVVMLIEMKLHELNIDVS